MKSFLYAIAVAGALAATLSPARAQLPTPSPDPHVYIDPGMNFTAPPEAVLMGRRVVSLADLTGDLQTVAVWAVHPGKEDMRLIQLSMESFEGAPNQWEGQFESQLHNSQDGVLIRNKTPIALRNGMPASFVEITSGSGFATKKQFAIVWADGQRGIVLSETARIGDSSAQEARRLLDDVTAVRYPIYQP